MRLKSSNSNDDARRAKDILTRAPKLAIDVARNVDRIGATAPLERQAFQRSRKGACAYLSDV